MNKPLNLTGMVAVIDMQVIMSLCCLDYAGQSDGQDVLASYSLFHYRGDCLAAIFVYLTHWPLGNLNEILNR